MARPVSARYMPISSGHAGEGPAHAVVGKEADAGLGHGKAVALAGDAMRAVERDADAGADHHPVDQRHGGLGEALELPVERIFRGQRFDRLRLAAAAPVGGLLDVAAGAEGAVATPRRSPPHRSADCAPSAGRPRRWPRAWRSVSALSAAGRFSVTRPAAPVGGDEDVAGRRSTPAVVWASLASTRFIPHVVSRSALCDCSASRATIRGIHDGSKSADTGSGCGGVRSRDLGLTRGANLQCVSDAWRRQRSAAWSLPQGHWRRAPAPSRAAAPQSLRHRRRPSSRRSGRRVLPDKARAKPAAVAPWSQQEIEQAQARCAVLLKGLDVVAVPERAHPRRRRVRHAPRP